jgi:polysaccharide pyruvyl transferase WcaK-like protein
MQKIGLVGLYSIDNMGDRLICEATRFIIEKHAKDVLVVEIDAAPRQISSYLGLFKLNLLISALLIRLAHHLFSRVGPRSKARYYLERFAWRLKLRWHFKKVIPSCDVVIFAGGGFLKYRTQGLNYIVEEVVDLCEIHGISIMFSAIGIEGFDIKDYRCRRLKATLSNPAIRSITTRDNLEILQTKYEIGASTHTSLAGDPAFWAPECYLVRKHAETKRIGINLIRDDIFQHYGYRLSNRDLKLFYVRLMDLLDEQGAEWVLFSNGMISDQEFGVALLKESGRSSERLSPPPSTARELVTLISSFRAILGARMHACISAYSLDIPIVGLIWNEKLTRFAEIIRQRHMFFDENELNAEEVCKKLLDTTVSDYDDEVRQDLKKRTQLEIINYLTSLRVTP